MRFIAWCLLLVSPAYIWGAEKKIHLVQEELVLKDVTGTIFFEPLINSPESVISKHLPKKVQLEGRRKFPHPLLYFINDKGSPIKNIPLESKAEEIKENGRVLERRYAARPVFSENGQWAVIDHLVQDIRFRMKDGTKEFYGGAVDTARVELYDRLGNIRFSKEFPKGRYLVGDHNSGILISDKGTTVIATDTGAGGGQPIVYVYAATGESLLEYSYKDINIGDVQLLKLSPNDRYLAVRAGFYDEPSATVFFDLKTKKSWRAKHDYVIFEMTDDGSVWCDYYDVEKRERGPVATINLKAYLGE